MKPALVLIGLGNPGASYVATRHNVGFQAIDVLSKEFGTGAWKENGKFESDVQEGRLLAAPLLFVKPRTYMNLSGTAIQKIVAYYKLNAAEQILVLCDDVDLPLGTLRLRQSGSAGTHNGLKSIVATLGQNFPRLRIGIGPKPAGADLATWVLSALTAEERRTLDETYAKIPEVVKEFVLGKAE